jgi:23S rRNA pseudouridine1911/1915/1917 synthase
VLVQAGETDSGKRLDSFLHERLSSYSRSRLQSWIKEGAVLVEGQAVRPAYLLRGTESISVAQVALPALRAEAEDLPLLHRFGKLSSANGGLRPGIVHRLDRDTSGLLVVARTDAAHQSLAEQFQTRAVEKIYLALVHGHLGHKSGKVTTSIGRDPVRRTRMTTRTTSGRSAHTEYRVVERPGDFDLLEVRIKTGRTHQIRVHLSSIGHPIAGDRLYGAPGRIKDLPPLERFFLHSHRLSFRSPSTRALITVESPLPSELASFLDALRSKGS